ncbi:TlpA family protein disulfide reductase [Roseateles sp. DXS20W]|uniref:TlpA family protein disulfide reductase n=1 Tax=Pelomonas lactea TaxID=3299030 RepID=A0ABW7GSI9_9BURK
MKRRALILSLPALAPVAHASPLDWFNGVSIGRKVSLPPLPYLDAAPQDNALLTMWYFWGTWCGPCRETIPLLNRWAKAYPEFQVIAVTDEAAEVVKPFVARVPMEVPVALDTKRKLFGEVKVRAVPYAMVLDRAGVVVWRGQPKELEAQAAIPGMLDRARQAVGPKS